MSEAGLKDALHRYVTDGEPPLAATSDALVHAGRRSVRLRRLVGGGTAALAALGLAAGLAAGAAVLPGLVDDRGSQGAGSPQRSGAALVVPPQCADEPAQLDEPQRLDDAARRLRVTCYLTRELSRLLPRTTFAQVGDGEAPRDVAPLHAYPRTSNPGLGADGLARDAVGAGMVLVVIVPRSADDGPPTEDACSSSACQLRAGPHDETVAVMRKHGQDGSISYAVFAYTDGAVVSVTATNHTADSTEPTRPGPPLGIEELVVLATDPALVVY
jgi:hypothetical protein